MYGGSGNGGADVITDFDHSGGIFSQSEGDRIDLRATGFSNFSAFQSAMTVSGNDTFISFSGGGSLTLQNVAKSGLDASDFMFAGTVAVTVQTPDGWNFGTLYDDLATTINNVQHPSNDFTHAFAVDIAKGITFELIDNGSPFTYDQSGHFTGGTINEIDILNTTDPTQTTQDQVLVNTNGWGISAQALFSDLGEYASQNPQGTGDLNAIFDQPSYSYVGSHGSESSHGSPSPGTDVFIGGNQADVFNGFGTFSPDGDTVSYANAGAEVEADLSNSTQNSGAALGDTYISIQNLIGSSFDDILIGDGGNSVLEGGPGDDIINGGGGSGGNNTASYQHATAAVTVDLSNPASQNTMGAGWDTLTDIQNVIGSNFIDTLTGNGHSMLEGGPGGDNLIGQLNGSDIASYQHAAVGVTVNLSNLPIANTGDAAGDTYTNINNLLGSSFNDTLIGNASANVLDGGFGGNDTLTGLAGADVFVFHGGNTTVTDFNHTESDQIDISGLNNGAGFTASALQALIDNSSGDTINFGNGNTVTLTNVDVHALVVSDFILSHTAL